ncbi:integral membrane protein [Corynebacterium suranareeae]|uniref:Integral membrane protein n=1 Tax=Corynebacterium suranareeae TaxID=2506452 RepID=A0A160PTW8_9CORY|nr:glycosyltransferase 87 family protein [Corynebacterium suranareeae]BAU96511.1 integral membrane protein [Corynebacterium suranareeae]
MLHRRTPLTQPDQWRKPALIVAILAVVGVLLSHWFAWPLTWPLGLRLPVDVEVYWQGAREFWTTDHLYEIRYDTTDDNLPFTYPPFGALVFTPLWWLHDVFGLLVAERIFALVTLLTTYAIAAFLLRLAGVRDRLWEFVAFAALLVSAPVYFTLNIGQINVILMALTLFDVALPHNTRHSGALKYVPLGVLTGIAAAIKITPLVFGLYFLILWAVTKSPRGLFGMIGGFLGASGLAFLFRPSISIQYFTDVLFTAERIGDLHFARNVSIRAVLERLPELGSAMNIIWLAAVALVIVAVGLACYRVLSSGLSSANRLLAVSLVSLIALLCSPVSWYHHWVWLGPLCVALWLTKHRWLSIWGVFALTFGSFHNFVPSDNDIELSWPWWIQILAAHYLIFSAAVIAMISAIDSTSSSANK